MVFTITGGKIAEINALSDPDRVLQAAAAALSGD
jgi:hypothetical protein